MYRNWMALADWVDDGWLELAVLAEDGPQALVALAERESIVILQ